MSNVLYCINMHELFCILVSIEYLNASIYTYSLIYIFFWNNISKF